MPDTIVIDNYLYAERKFICFVFFFSIDVVIVDDIDGDADNKFGFGVDLNFDFDVVLDHNVQHDVDVY